jgi:YfiH family protein
MIERAECLGGLSGVVHGFAGRGGAGHERSFDVGGRFDAERPFRENLARLAEVAVFDPADLVLVRQVHGRVVVRARDAGPETEADAIWLHRRDPRALVAVVTADCVPVLMADEAATVVAAVHSGWRGTVAGVVAATVSTLAGAGVDPSTLLAAIGPCIEWPAFEVGPEVAALFCARHVHDRGLSRPHVDLVAAVREQLVAAGVPAERIERVGGCTHQDPRRYFSYRRDGAPTGGQLSYIGFVAHG